MIDNNARFTTRSRRATGVDSAATPEPSHIHVPRPSRVARPDGGDRAARTADLAEATHHGRARRVSGPPDPEHRQGAALDQLVIHLAAWQVAEPPPRPV